MSSKLIPVPVIATAILALGSGPAPGLIFFDTADPAHNREVAPGGAWTGSGWQYQGEFKIFLGTMISPRHFLTARHFGAGGGTTFTHRTWFSGQPTNRVYYVNPNFNGGLGLQDIPGTDFRIIEVYGDFPGYAELYTKPNEAGREVVMMGRGRQRGTEVTLLAQTRGWEWGGDDRRARWGVNQVDSIDSTGTGDLLVTDFDEAPGTEEAHAATGDSGGGLFIKDGATWKLAGIFFATDGKYDTNAVCGDGTEFDAAMFDAVGFFLGSDNGPCDNWLPASAANDTDQSRAFASRVSASAAAIQAIIQPAIDDAAKTPLQRYDDWMAEFGLSSETLPEEDADADLQPNVVEYLAALDPGAVDEPQRAFLVEEVAGGKIRFTVRIRLDAEARGLTWEIQGADNLVTGNYTAVTGLTQVGLVRSRLQGVETIQFEVNQPAGTHMFYRLEVTMAP